MLGNFWRVLCTTTNTRTVNVCYVDIIGHRLNTNCNLGKTKVAQRVRTLAGNKKKCQDKIACLCGTQEGRGRRWAATPSLIRYKPLLSNMQTHMAMVQDCLWRHITSTPEMQVGKLETDVCISQQKLMKNACIIVWWQPRRKDRENRRTKEKG
jgi:hypothetical protein